MKRLLLLFLFCYSSFIIYAQEEIINFDSDRWNILRGEVSEHLGYQSFSGRAVLTDANFKDGTIEYDLAINGERSYPGLFFRVQNPGDYEHFYIRPHRIWYDDAMQYAPAYNGASCWQLFNGEGCTAPYKFPYDQWIHFRIVIKGDQALVYIDENESPSLHIVQLDHETVSGGIILDAPANGSAYFANFKISDKLPDDFPASRKMDIPYGMIREWEISNILDFGNIDHQKDPAGQELDELEWSKVSADLSGLVNLSKIYPRTYRTGDAVFARTYIDADEDMIKEITFGYSDIISIFLNGQVYYTGVSTYRSRDLSFLGIIGLNDQVYLPLKKGENELMIMVGEGFGGWGFMMQTADIYEDVRMTKKWETDDVFKVPESVLYDQERDVLYVTNFDQFTRNASGREQFISKISTEGEILDMHFIDSLDNPLGMKIHKDKIYVAEKGGIAIADIKSAKVVDRIPIPECQFPNDIEVDAEGRIYISDSRKNVVWRIDGDGIAVWLDEGQVLDPNTLKIIGDRLYVGNSGFQQLNAYSLENKEMDVIADFGPGFIDGIRSLPGDELLVSLWDGKLYHIDAEGAVKNLLDLKNQGIYIADFEYIHDKRMLYIPGFFYSRVVAYEINW